MATKEIDELFKDQCAEMDELLKSCINQKEVKKRMWKLKELLCGPKIVSEPSCIHDPVRRCDLITDKENIKEVSLKHCFDILTKNKIRECDIAKLEAKKELHEEIINKDNKDSYELSVGLYKEVLKSLGKKGKKMFNLLNKAWDKYREAIYWYMRRIISNETIPGGFLITWLIAI